MQTTRAARPQSMGSRGKFIKLDVDSWPASSFVLFFRSTLPSLHFLVWRTCGCHEQIWKKAASFGNNWIIYPPDLHRCARIPETNRVVERSSTLPLRAVGIEPGHTAARMDGRQSTWLQTGATWNARCINAIQHNLKGLVDRREPLSISENETLVNSDLNQRTIVNSDLNQLTQAAETVLNDLLSQTPASQMPHPNRQKSGAICMLLS